MKFIEYAPLTEIGKGSGSLAFSQSFSKELVNPVNLKNKKSNARADLILGPSKLKAKSML